MSDEWGWGGYAATKSACADWGRSTSVGISPPRPGNELSPCRRTSWPHEGTGVPACGSRGFNCQPLYGVAGATAGT